MKKLIIIALALLLAGCVMTLEGVGPITGTEYKVEAER